MWLPKAWPEHLRESSQMPRWCCNRVIHKPGLASPMFVGHVLILITLLTKRATIFLGHLISHYSILTCLMPCVD